MNFPLPLRLLGLAASLSGLLFSASCTYEKGGQDIPKPCTDVITSVSYSLDIKPIIEQNCYKCHSKETYLLPGINGSGHNWESYQELRVYAMNGSLLGTLEHQDPLYAAVYMPRLLGTRNAAPRLAACDIERIRSWVRAGAPNN